MLQNYTKLKQINKGFLIIWWDSENSKKTGKMRYYLACLKNERKYSCFQLIKIYTELCI